MIFRIAAALVGCAFIGFYFLSLNDPELFEKLQTIIKGLKLDSPRTSFRSLVFCSSRMPTKAESSKGVQ